MRIRPRAILRPKTPVWGRPSKRIAKAPMRSLTRHLGPSQTQRTYIADDRQYDLSDIAGDCNVMQSNSQAL